MMRIFPNVAFWNDKCDKYYTKKEIEDMLGIKILTNSLMTTDKYILDYSVKNEGKIAQLSFQLAENMTDDSKINENENNNIYRSYVALSTKYNDEFDNTLIGGGTKDYEVYHIKSIDEDAFVMKSKGPTNLYLITFVHDNLMYRYEILFKGSNAQMPDEVYPKFLEEITE